MQTSRGNGMHKPTFARGAAVVTALSLAFGLAACGDNAPASSAISGASGASSVSGADGGPNLQGEFAGSGASSQQSANEAWIADFHASHNQARISYDPAGSGAGVTALLNGSVIWAGSDEPLNAAQLEQSKSTCARGTAFEVPVYVTPIAFAYNLPSVGLNDSGKHLRMEPETIAAIFQGQITRWNDARLARLNPGVGLPDLPITVVHRSDKSGTTKSLFKYLKAAAGPAWPYEPGENWPNNVGQGAKGTAGLVMTLTQAEGTFGYADAAQTSGLGTVAVKVGESYVPASERGVSKMMDKVKYEAQPQGSLRKLVKVDYQTAEPGAYPVLLVSYDIACQAYQRDASGSKAAFAKSWLSYLASEAGQQQAAANAGSVPLTPAIREQVMQSVQAIEAS
ncbi:phosphate-binding protein PstS [Bombiscardovia apis]|uniref:Phosphate-binding protein n=1 Tax=Bombiscardovia apis TaxID=2932182 RepID=A0ABM8BBE8_9BIFI|nr:phosphate ABC transporter substrate-binding protein PstS [Bombiscardovia apis]BDR54239.1 phosphate-binding protein PstS [Bombiscardovia apis]